MRSRERVLNEPLLKVDAHPPNPMHVHGVFPDTLRQALLRIVEAKRPNIRNRVETNPTAQGLKNVRQR